MLLHYDSSVYSTMCITHDVAINMINNSIFYYFSTITKNCSTQYIIHIRSSVIMWFKKQQSSYLKLFSNFDFQTNFII